MKRDTQRLTQTEFDLVIIGGGIFGACAAWDATLRGLKVALIEKFDFASGVSANSFKVVHGGMRYLQHGDIKRLRASCHERSAFLRIAPHLVQPLPIVVPTYGHGKSGKAFLATGLYIYDLLTFDRNRKIRDRTRHTPVTKLLNKSEILKEFPDIDQDGLTGGVIFHDGRMYNPTRLVLSFVQAAHSKGAVVINQMEAQDFILEDNRVTAIKAYDHCEKQAVIIQTKSVLNASGPWSEILFKNIPQFHKPGITYSRDACFVVKKRIDSALTIAIQGRTRDPDALLSRPARHLFISPWRDYTLIGVWHVVTDVHPENITVGKEELSSFIDEINWAYPALQLKIDDVLLWNAGLVPFGENEPGSENLSYGKRSHILDHEKLDGIYGITSIIGVRYTMGRGDSEKAIDMIQKKLHRPIKRAATDYLPVYGGDIDDFSRLVDKIQLELPSGTEKRIATALAHNHGSQYRKVLDVAAGNKELLAPFTGTTVLKAEVLNAIHNEMALTLSDIVFRRTDLATGENPGMAILRECANIAATELGWTDTEVDNEINQVLRRFPDFNDKKQKR